MYRKLWRLLSVFHPSFWNFLFLVAFLEGLQIIGSSTLGVVIWLLGENPSRWVWVAFFGAHLAFDEVNNRFGNEVNWRIISHLDYPIYRFLKSLALVKFLGLDLGWHEDQNSGVLVGRVDRGVDKIDSMIDQICWHLVPVFLELGLVIIPFVFLSPQTVPIVLATAVCFVWLTIRSNQAKEELRAERYDCYDRESKLMVEAVRAVRTLFMFGQGRRFVYEHSRTLDRIVELGLRQAEIGIFTYNRWRIRVMSLAKVVILIVWVSQFQQGSLGIVGLAYARTLIDRLFGSLWRLDWLITNLFESSEGARRLTDLLDQTSTPVCVGKIREVETPVGICLKDVCFAYSGQYCEENGEGSIHHLSLEISPGEVVALVGESGAGKTTIPKLITGQRPIHSGTITVGGAELEQWRHSALLEYIAEVPQGDEVDIFSETIFNNIAFSKPDATEEEVVEAAQMAEIHDFVVGLPDGYNTNVKERGIRLSGGQKQRVALARAFLADPQILVLDEATSQLDARTERRIQEQLVRFFANRTVIVIAHRLSTIRFADKIAVLHKGRKVEEGTYDELMKLGGRFAEMVRLQTSE